MNYISGKYQISLIILVKEKPAYWAGFVLDADPAGEGKSHFQVVDIQEGKINIF